MEWQVGSAARASRWSHCYRINSSGWKSHATRYSMATTASECERLIVPIDDPAESPTAQKSCGLRFPLIAIGCLKTVLRKKRLASIPGIQEPYES